MISDRRLPLAAVERPGSATVCLIQNHILARQGTPGKPATRNELSFRPGPGTVPVTSGLAALA